MYTPANPMPDGAIYRIARDLGFDDEGARVAIAIALTEGGRTGRRGDQGWSTNCADERAKSCGPYQFYWCGQLPAFAAYLTADNERACIISEQDQALAVHWALTGYIGTKIHEGQGANIHGPSLAVYVQRTAQVSEYNEVAGIKYAQIAGVDYRGWLDQPAPTPTLPFLPLLAGLALTTAAGYLAWQQFRGAL